MQVMNVAAKVEKQGFGTKMYSKFEEFMRREGYSIIVWYPADNNVAPKFWGSQGFKSRRILPMQERLRQGADGIIKEKDVATGEILPLWEKDITKKTLPRRAAANYSFKEA